MVIGSRFRAVKSAFLRRAVAASDGPLLVRSAPWATPVIRREGIRICRNIILKLKLTIVKSVF